MRRIIQVVLFLGALAAIECQDEASPVKINITGPVERIDCSKDLSSENRGHCNEHCPNAPGGMAILTGMGSSGDSKGKGCSESDGFFKLPSSAQCFRAYPNQNTTWATATSFCENNGLVLAEPIDDVAADLQKYLNDKYGSETYWVNGKGTGPKVTWQRSGSEVSASGDLWIFDGPGEYSERDPFCLILFATNSSIKRFLGRPYDTTECNSEWQKQRIPLCERVMA